MVYLEQAQPEQLQELLAFAEEAFRTPEGKVDFPTLLPKLYGPGADSAPLHTVLYEDGAPAGLYCLKIQDFNIAGTALRVGGIGTVCVDGRSRGKGHLALLMQDAQERMQAAGCDIAMLGGQRQRYERFGYVPAGAHWEFTLTPRNVRDIRTGGVALAPLAEYPSWLESARALHEKQPVTCARGGDASFLTVLQSWRASHMRFCRTACSRAIARWRRENRRGCRSWCCRMRRCCRPLRRPWHSIRELPVYVYSFTRGSGRSLPILPLWRNRAFVCQTTATAFSIGRLRPAPQWRCSALMTIRRF